MKWFSNSPDFDELEFNDPFDNWLRSMKPEISDFAKDKERFLADFKVKLQADIETRKNRPFYKKLAFWR